MGTVSEEDRDESRWTFKHVGRRRLGADCIVDDAVDLRRTHLASGHADMALLLVLICSSPVSAASAFILSFSSLFAQKRQAEYTADE